MSETSPPAGPEPVIGDSHWLYVTGAGRSGTTMLGLVLAQDADAFYCGELTLLWERLADGALCQCQAPVTRCEVWAAVAAGVRRQLGFPPVEDLAQQIIGMRRPYTDIRIPRPTAAQVELREVTERMVEEVTGATSLVDTSKSFYVLAAAARRDRQLSVVHVVRDPRAVAYSGLRPKVDPARGGAVHQPQRPVWKSALKWSLINVRTERVLRSMTRRGCRYSSTRVSYEAATASPAETLGAIASSLQGGHGSSVPQGHAVAGNPAMFDHETFIADDRWRTGMTRRQNAVVAAIAGPLMVRYGYRLDPSQV